jgi:RsiW-degrading membrane proteinase PrsW (M82 family)
MLISTFILGILFASFAAVFNSLTRPFFSLIPIVGTFLFFFLIVGPVEETVKWLAIRLYAYRTSTFQTVLDGAVYGAVAGLGFATIENTLYITQNYLATMQAGALSGQPVEAVLPVAFARTLAGPGHVLYSALAGYYLGLAKFNPENAGPIIVKGLFLAAMVHALYNSLVSILPLTLLWFIGFIIIYDGTLAYIIYRKINRYRDYYNQTNAATHIRDGTYTPHPQPEQTSLDDDGEEHQEGNSP